MKKFTSSILIVLALSSCTFYKKQTSTTLDVAEAQTEQMLLKLDKQKSALMPRTTHNEETRFSSLHDWTSGFFPGTLWYLSELTGKDKWRVAAVKYTEKMEQIQYLKWHHDIGFMMGCSYGNGFTFSANEAYKPIIVESAKSLATRFRPNAGIIQSWNSDRGWQGKRGWKCPVIIDNMMNLELMFMATEISGDSTYYNIALSHADQTLKNHYRDDMSCYHVVDYDPESGVVRSKETAQGYANESDWARGQAWGIYGFTLCYGFTKDERYLERAIAIAEYLMNHPQMPEDQIPLWDFDAPSDKMYRDASAAAVTASALFELSEYAGKKYKKYANVILESLMSDDYIAKVGENGSFILKHSVGSIPHGAEIDKPLVYADYYLLEALYRRENGVHR